jgi:hypothetical protein
MTERLMSKTREPPELVGTGGPLYAIARKDYTRTSVVHHGYEKLNLDRLRPCVLFTIST